MKDGTKTRRKATSRLKTPKEDLVGPAEDIEGGPELFESVDQSCRILRSSKKMRGRRKIPTLPLKKSNKFRELEGMKFGQSAEPSIAEHHKKALEKHAPPSVLVDENFEILHLSPTAGRFLIHPGGVPTSLLLKLIREELRIELQTALFQSFEHRLATSSPPIKVRFNGQERFVSLVVQPVVGDNDSEMALVLFLEVGETREAYTGGGKTTLPREKHLEGELRKVREQLRCTIEEFESSEEEMKASNEELQSMSEEHRSTGEELETNKEELQFVNEKLERVNQELAGKVKALRQANSDLQNLIASLKQDVIRRKALQKKNVEARARQQRSLGERIHDGLAQQVSGVRMLAKSFLQQSKKDKQINPDDVEELLRHLESAENEIQTVVRELVPITFEENAGLVVALERMVERLSELWPAADCRIEADDSVSVVDDLAALKLYHIAQEAVQNALKHGHPTRVLLRIRAGRDGEILFEVEDNGRGFTEKDLQDAQGMGIELMRHRAEVIDARLEITPGKKRGTIVRCFYRPRAADSSESNSAP